MIKQEIKFEDHENCLKGNQLEKKRKKIWFEKNDIETDCKSETIFKRQLINIKPTTKI